MIPHRSGDLLGAKFTWSGWRWVSLGRGPGNTVIACKQASKEKTMILPAEVYIMPLPKPHEIDPTTPVRAEELEERNPNVG